MKLAAILLAAGLSVGVPMSIQDRPDFSSAAASPSAGAITIANPAAGHDWTYTFTQSGRLVSVIGALLTSATAGNRAVLLEITDQSGHEIWSMPPSAVQGPSLDYTYEYTCGMPYQVNSIYPVLTFALAPLPTSMFVQSGWTLTSHTNNIAATDQWGGITVVTTPS